MKYKVKYDMSHITSVEALRSEQLVVKRRIQQREEELRNKMYEIPAELAAAGVNSLIPGIFRGKITDAALNGGKKLLNAFIVPESQQPSNMLTQTVKHRGIFSLIKKGIKIWKGK